MATDTHFHIDTLTGLVTMQIEITVEAYEKICELATQSGMSLPQAASVLLTAQIEKHTKLEEVIQQMVSEAFDAKYRQFEEELIRLNAPTEKANRIIEELLPDLKSKLQKKESN
jgi:hypothetical protein